MEGIWTETFKSERGDIITKVCGIRQFNLTQIAESGQCFRWYEIEEEELQYGEMGYWICAYGTLLRVEQDSDELYLWCIESDFYKIWLHYFDLETDYEPFIKAVEGDKFLKKAAAYGSGIRILNQEPFETIISFMLSSANNIPRIKSLINNLCESYGTEIYLIDKYTHKHKRFGTYHTFPSADRLFKVSEQEFRQLGMGFRAANIYKFLRDLYKDDPGSIEENERIRTLWHILQNVDKSIKIHELLMTVDGIGDKIASCVELFAYHNLDAFPIDVWIDRILFIEYGGGDVPMTESKRKKFREQILDKHFSKYAGFRGVIQQYMYYYYRVTQ